jgi:hypothetical protein
MSRQLSRGCAGITPVFTAVWCRAGCVLERWSLEAPPLSAFTQPIPMISKCRSFNLVWQGTDVGVKIHVMATGHIRSKFDGEMMENTIFTDACLPHYFFPHTIKEAVINCPKRSIWVEFSVFSQIYSYYMHCNTCGQYHVSVYSIQILVQQDCSQWLTN